MADEVGDIERREPPDVGLVQTQEPAAGGKIVVDDVEDLALHASPEPRECDRLRAVVDVRERDGVAATHVQEDSERPDPHSARDTRLAGTVHRPRPDDDVRDPEFLAILGDGLLLFDLGEAVGLAPQLGTVLHRTPFVQQPPPRFRRVRIHGERADVDEAPQAAIPQARLEEIAGRDDRVHERIGKGLLAGSGRQVEDHGGILGRRGTISLRQEIAPDHVDARSAVGARQGFEPGDLARGPGETAQVAESTLEQGADEPRADEPRGARDEDTIGGLDDEVVVFSVWEHAVPIQGCGRGAHAVLPASTVRTVPPPSAIMWRTTYLVRTIGESVFTRMRRSICELCMIARAPSAAAAALLTSP